MSPQPHKTSGTLVSLPISGSTCQDAGPAGYSSLRDEYPSYRPPGRGPPQHEVAVVSVMLDPFRAGTEATPSTEVV